jgi:hypothetical protein
MSIIIKSSTRISTRIHALQALTTIITLPAVIPTLVGVVVVPSAVQALRTTVLIAVTISTGGSAVVVIVEVVGGGCFCDEVVVEGLSKCFNWATGAWGLFAVFIFGFTCRFWAYAWFLFFAFFAFFTFSVFYESFSSICGWFFSFFSLFFVAGDRFTVFVSFFTLHRYTFLLFRCQVHSKRPQHRAEGFINPTPAPRTFRTLLAILWTVFFISSFDTTVAVLVAPFRLDFFCVFICYGALGPALFKVSGEALLALFTMTAGIGAVFEVIFEAGLAV